MIPCIVCPFLNRPDLLQRMVSSIDFPVEDLFILNNSDFAISLHLLELPKSVSGWSERVGDNLGVAGSWNAGLSFSFVDREHDYAIFVGNDIQWSSGDLEKFDKAFRENPECDFISGNWAFSTFALTRKGFQRLGWFDETIHPAYGEDVDFWKRACLTSDFSAVSVDTHAIHGEAPTWGSSTIYSDPEIRRKNHHTHNANLSYLERKWGWDRNKDMASAEFMRPFGDESKRLDYWELAGERLSSPYFRSNGNS
jgi:hypothetical protein